MIFSEDKELIRIEKILQEVTHLKTQVTITLSKNITSEQAEELKKVLGTPNIVNELKKMYKTLMEQYLNEREKEEVDINVEIELVKN